MRYQGLCISGLISCVLFTSNIPRGATHVQVISELNKKSLTRPNLRLLVIGHSYCQTFPMWEGKITLKMASMKIFLNLMNAPPSWVFFVCKKRQYRGEIALVTNLRPLMFEQLLRCGYILYCLIGEYNS